MDAENTLIAQVEATKKQHPRLRQFVYRNSVHAMPWFASVRTKMADPAFSGFFLKFAPSPPRANGTYFSPNCDTTRTPPLCSRYYHDQTQTPSPARHPNARQDGLCRGECDCGNGIPCGFYLFNHLNGSMFRRWFVEEHVGGAAGTRLLTAFSLMIFGAGTTLPARRGSACLAVCNIRSQARPRRSHMSC